MKVALTGGIGCGKSTVVKEFTNFGWKTIETDSIVRNLLDSDSRVRAILREWWGEAIFKECGKVDRGAIALRVFDDAIELERLERLLHPLVINRWRKQLDSDCESDWLVEIPLLFEKRLETEFEFSVSIYSSSGIVVDRMVQRGFSELEIEKRRARQLPLSEKIRMSDFVLSNDGNLRFLNSQIAFLIEYLKQ